MGRPTPDDSLPQHVAEAIPQTVPNEVHYAWWSEGGDRAGNCSWNSAHLQSDETYHQDHVRPRHHRRHRKEVGKLPIGHPVIGSDEVMDIRESREESAEALRAWPRTGNARLSQPLGVGVLLMTRLWLGGIGPLGARASGSV